MFKDRTEAGVKLAKALRKFASAKTIVLALPRGGVEVGFEVAKALNAPLDTIVARKVGAPGNTEYAIGAIAPGGIKIVDESISGVDDAVRRETAEMERRIKKYRSGFYSRKIQPDNVIVVDDGVATGKTATVALAYARAAHPKAKIVFAAPVASQDSLRLIEQNADEVVCLLAPPDFMAVGEWYVSFPQLKDEEVISYLEKARAE